MSGRLGHLTVLVTTPTARGILRAVVPMVAHIRRRIHGYIQCVRIKRAKSIGMITTDFFTANYSEEPFTG